MWQRYLFFLFNPIFLQIFSLDIQLLIYISYFCTRKLTPSHLKRVWSGRRREHYILECVADALFLAILKLPQSKRQVKSIAEVDATGRYIPFPLVCRWLTMPSRTPLGAYYIYQRRGYHSVSFTCLGCGRPQNGERAEARYPAFLL